MPKRVIDGEGVWGSDKIAQVQPPEFRAEYTNLVPLALANGVFKVNARRVWSKVYSFNRDNITPEIVEAVLAEFERVRLLFRWRTPDGQEWGYWTGSDRPGRLPPPSRLKKSHEPLGPEPPEQELQRFLSGQEANGQPLVSHEVANGSLGFGSGSGSGSGINPSSNPDGFDQRVLSEGKEDPPCSKPKTAAGDISKTKSNHEFSATEVAWALCKEQGWAGTKIPVALAAAITHGAAGQKSVDLKAIATDLVGRWHQHEQAAAFPNDIATFFSGAYYKNYGATRKVVNPAEVMEEERKAQQEALDSK